VHAFERAIKRGAAQEAVAHPLGEAFFHRGFPKAWSINLLQVDAPEVRPDELVTALDELFDGYDHRRAAIERPDVAAALVDAFRGREDWTVDREVLMVLRRDRDRPAEPGLAREVAEDEIRALQRLTYAETGEGAEGMVMDYIEGMHRALAASAPVTRFFVGAADGVDACTTTLYSDGRLAQIEDVSTLTAHRGRGLARATISAAIDAAQAMGPEMIYLWADADGTPRELYAKLGFDPIAVCAALLRR